ncbi:AMP-binding protein [Chelatococcus asaccharovorans]|uniref:AMP-binding protein n=1 Tax=Chelatococcus asaccharovorans TaxID=28210 RepID=UPI00224C7A3F|nr:AMP-binding protein [Chelatococcus asaccharovorans]CAH1653301.1 2,3-dihydroxybenzoate-AMP ligase siderophore [Chelatococcus asaccharovorans]CAH1686085.1 2,3-dihydroxybenzoate-AMP ligase siderophore [Chelatococcus asaccharovorans]
MPVVSSPMQGVVYPPRAEVARYDEMGLFSDDTMGQAFRKVAARFPNRAAVSDASSAMSFVELDEVTDRLAGSLLRSGLKPLDRVTFQIPNGKELVICFVACLKAGLIPICTLVAHRQAEIGYLSAHAKARAHLIASDDPKFDFLAFARSIKSQTPSMDFTIIGRGPAPANEPGVSGIKDLIDGISLADAREILGSLELDAAQVAVFQLSGGTSGIPKIIPRFHNEYLYQLRTVAEWHGLTEKTVAFSPAPMMHNAPIVCYWGSTLWSGGEVVCAASLQPEAIAEVLAARHPNWMSIPLPILLNLKAAGLLDRRNFEGARLSTPSHTARLSDLTGGTAVPLYGMTEGIITYGRIGDPDFVLRSTVGRPVGPHDEFRIVDPETGQELPDGELGEFCFRGPSSCRGYYDAEDRNSEAFTAEGFCKSGDLMRAHLIDGVRYVSFEGRVKDVVSRGGEKINCQEVERALINHPAVGAIAIVPMPDPVYSEKACAFVIPAKGAEPLTVAGAGAFLEKAGLAKFKWPERIEIVSEFPTTSSGKISKPLLKQRIAAQLDRERGEAARAKPI